MEEVWDAILSSGTLLYGIAVDDAHTFKQPGNPDVAGPGRGWVVVRAARLEPRALLEAIERGDFYASTGVELSDYQVDEQDDDRRGESRRRSRSTGSSSSARAAACCASRTEPTATYEIRGDEGYVRARVLESNGRLAWCQPVLVPASSQGHAVLILMLVAAACAGVWRSKDWSLAPPKRPERDGGPAEVAGW